MTRSSVAVLLLLLAGCATGTPAADSGPHSDQKQLAGLDRALRGLTPGAPQQCIDSTLVQQEDRYGTTVLFEYSPAMIYRNDPTEGCRGIARGDIIVSRHITTEECEGDIITTVTDTPDHTFTGSCTLGKFVPYRR